MDLDHFLFWTIAVIGAGAIVGFFLTKKSGFGKYTTSALLLLIVVVLSSLMFAAGKFSTTFMANIMFAALGFACGLYTGKEDSEI